MIKIEKDNILNEWIVWDVHKNYSVDMFRSKTKKEAKGWLNKNGKTNKKRRRN